VQVRMRPSDPADEIIAVESGLGRAAAAEAPKTEGRPTS